MGLNYNMGSNQNLWLPKLLAQQYSNLTIFLQFLQCITISCRMTRHLAKLGHTLGAGVSDFPSSRCNKELSLFQVHIKKVQTEILG